MGSVSPVIQATQWPGGTSSCQMASSMPTLKSSLDALPHSIIKEAVAAQVADGHSLNLLEKFLRSGIMEEGGCKPTTVGTPQGGVVSPLRANIVLNPLDWRRMRPKSERKFKEKIQDLTVRKRTRDATVIEELNWVIRGTAQYFATHWSTVQSQFHELDGWIRRRGRCMRLPFVGLAWTQAAWPDLCSQMTPIHAYP
jgi:hypothetical protein